MKHQIFLIACHVLSPNLMRRLERWIQLSLGKGYFGASIDDEVSRALKLLPSHLGERLVVIDVGANRGDWSAALRRQQPNAEVFALEPSKTAFDLLERRFSLDERVRCLNIAAAESEGSRELFSDYPGSGLASFSQRRLRHFSIRFEYSEIVQTVSLDDLCHELELSPALVKLDVEGHELRVLAGAVALMLSVDVVQFEFGGCNLDSRYTFQDLFYFFSSHGFALWRLCPKGLVLVDSYSESDETYVHTIYFAQKMPRLSGADSSQL